MGDTRTSGAHVVTPAPCGIHEPRAALRGWHANLGCARHHHV